MQSSELGDANVNCKPECDHQVTKIKAKRQCKKPTTQYLTNNDLHNTQEYPRIKCPLEKIIDHLLVFFPESEPIKVFYVLYFKKQFATSPAFLTNPYHWLMFSIRFSHNGK